MKVKLTKNDAEEVWHKLTVLHDTEDLLEDYQVSKEQVQSIIDTVPKDGGDWTIPTWSIDVVKCEMRDHAVVLRAIADDARAANEIGQSLAAHRQAAKFEEEFN